MFSTKLCTKQEYALFARDSKCLGNFTICNKKLTIESLIAL